MPIGMEKAPNTTTSHEQPRAVSYAPGYVPPAATETSQTEAQPAETKTAEQPQSDNAADGSTPPADAPPGLSKTEQRKQYLAESKLVRKAREESKRAQQELKKAQELAAKAEKFANISVDPITALKDAGFNPEDIYRSMTKAYIDGGSKEDPVAMKVQEAVNPYIQKLEEERNKVARHNELMEETQVVTHEVMPILQDVDKYSSILAFNNNNQGAAAIGVYQKVKDHYTKTGEIISFQEAADKMEDEFTQKLETGLKIALGMKKFSKYMSTENQSLGTNPASMDQSKQPARTLTNSKGLSPAAPEAAQSFSSGSAKLDKLLKKHNLK